MPLSTRVSAKLKAKIFASECEVVRDLAQKAGEWIWYDEQFRYLRQTAPEKYPWDQIHWELWIRSSSSFRKTQPLTNKQSQPNRSRFRSQFFPKGTCWAFEAGKHCPGCQFTHECFKCRAKHPGSQCSSPSAQNRPNFSSKGPRGGTQIQSPSQPAFSLGFPINFVGERCAMDSPSLKSALERPIVTSANYRRNAIRGG